MRRVVAVGSVLLCACTAPSDGSSKRYVVEIAAASVEDALVGDTLSVEAQAFEASTHCLLDCSKEPYRSALFRDVTCTDDACAFGLATPDDENDHAYRFRVPVSPLKPGPTIVGVELTTPDGQHFSGFREMSVLEPAEIHFGSSFVLHEGAVTLPYGAFDYSVYTADARAHLPDGRVLTSRAVRSHVEGDALELVDADDHRPFVMRTSKPGTATLVVEVGRARVSRTVRVVSPSEVARLELRPLVSARTAEQPLYAGAPVTQITVPKDESVGFAAVAVLADDTIALAPIGTIVAEPTALAVGGSSPEPVVAFVLGKEVGKGVLRVGVVSSFSDNTPPTLELPLEVTAP